MVQGCKEAYLSLGSFKRKITEEELEQRINMRRSLISNKSMKKGQIITESDILMKRPGDGIPPNQIDKILGGRLLEDIDEETQFEFEKIKH